MVASEARISREEAIGLLNDTTCQKSCVSVCELESKQSIRFPSKTGCKIIGSIE